MNATDPSPTQPPNPGRESEKSQSTLAHNCLTADQLAARWGKSKATIHRMNADPDHPLKSSAISRRPLYFPLPLIRNIEEGHARPEQ